MAETQTLTKAEAYAEELFKKIEDNNITVDPVVWDLMGHVLGNRIYSITLILSDLLDTPKWILNAGSRLMIFLYKISGNQGEMNSLSDIAGRISKNADQATEFMSRLRQTTKQRKGF